MSRRPKPEPGLFDPGPAVFSRWQGPAGYAVAGIAATASVAALLTPGVGPGMGTALFLAVIASAGLGGKGPGFFAIAVVVLEALALRSYYELPVGPRQYVGLPLFAAAGVVITLVIEALHAARRRAEEGGRWLAAVLASIGDAVIATDARGRVTFVNPVARELTGWGEGEAVGRAVEEVLRVVSGADGAPAENPVARVLRDGAPVGLPAGTVLLARDGSGRPIEDSAAPIRHDGAVRGVVLVFHDVTERSRAEAERERFLAALRENDRLKDEFLDMLAHELRNPMAAIGSAVALSEAPGGADHAGWAAEVIGRQTKHLTRLVDDLLDVSRINRGQIELRPERLDAAAPVAAALDAVAPLARERGHEVLGDVPRDTLWVDADPTRLQQVVVNLLTNALQFTDAPGHIRLSAGRDGGEVVIRVRDDGRGIRPEVLPRVFDLFTQGDRSLARTEGGLGIGLTVVKSIVERLGGTVTAASAGAGLGSEFVVRLPAAEKPAAAPAPEPPPDTPASQGGRARVLIVDDNKDIVRGLSRLLKILGHDVRGAHDGPEAIEAARNHAPDFVLLDIGLPGMDGFQVAAALRQEPACAKAVLIAITGYGRDEDRRRSREAGFNHHLVKPVDHDVLITLLSTAPEV